MDTISQLESDIQQKILGDKIGGLYVIHWCRPVSYTHLDVYKRQPLYRESKVKKVIGIVSGKGGVGKSMTTSLLGVAAMRKGLHTAILDADVTGPSIPQAFGLHERLLGNAEGIILPAMTNFGIEVVSLNLMLEEETQPVIWRGPVVACLLYTSRCV